jgi:hypothetical protein
LLFPEYPSSLDAERKGESTQEKKELDLFANRPKRRSSVYHVKDFVDNSS